MPPSSRIASVLATLVAISAVTLLPGTASAQGTQRTDPAGDARGGAAYDIVAVTVDNAAKRLRASVSLGSVEQSSRRVVVQIDARFGGEAIYHLTTLRKADGTIRSRLTRSATVTDAPAPVRCRVRAAWPEDAAAPVTLSVAQSCLPDAAAGSFRVSTAPVLDSQDPYDFLQRRDGAPAWLRLTRG